MFVPYVLIPVCVCMCAYVSFPVLEVSLILFNLVSVRMTGIVQNVSVVFKLLTISVLVVAGIVYIGEGRRIPGTYGCADLTCLDALILIHAN